MTTAACPRHGVFSLAADVPCPTCATLLFDVDNRDAAAVVANSRKVALKPRRAAITAALFVVCALGSGAVSFTNGFSINIVMLVVIAMVAAFLSKPISTVIERDQALRSLDRALARKR